MSSCRYSYANYLLLDRDLSALQVRYNEFYQLMEELLDYGEEKHGAASFQAIVASGKIERTDRLRNCLFHSAEHIKAYNLQEPHDKFGDLEHQLAAVAVNAMIEFILMRAEKEKSSESQS